MKAEPTDNGIPAAADHNEAVAGPAGGDEYGTSISAAFDLARKRNGEPELSMRADSDSEVDELDPESEEPTVIRPAVKEVTDTTNEATDATKAVVDANKLAINADKEVTDVDKETMSSAKKASSVDNSNGEGTSVVYCTVSLC